MWNLQENQTLDYLIDLEINLAKKTKRLKLSKNPTQSQRKKNKNKNYLAQEEITQPIPT